jgi:hypothetical protein
MLSIIVAEIVVVEVISDCNFFEVVIAVCMAFPRELTDEGLSGTLEVAKSFGGEVVRTLVVKPSFK